MPEVCATRLEFKGVQEDRLAAATRMRTKEKIVAAYEAYQRSEPGSADNLMVLVRDFAYTKLQYLDHEFSSGVVSAEDFAQDVALDVWSALVGTSVALPESGPSFYAWIHKIAFNHATDGFNRLKEEKDRRVPLQHEVMEGDEVFEDDNPEIYEHAISIDKSKWNEKDKDGNIIWEYNGEVVPGSERSQFEIGSVPVRIPKWVRGQNLVICNYVLQGLTYKQIGKALGLTEKAVDRRLERIRRRTRQESKRDGVEDE